MKNGNKIKINLITGRYSPPNFRGGIETYVYYFDKYLRKNNYETIIYTKSEKIDFDNSNNNILKLKVWRIPVLITLLFQFKIRGYLKKSQFANIHNSTFGVLLPKKTKLILTLHTLASEEGSYLNTRHSLKKKLKSLSRRSIIRYFEKITLSNVAHIIVLNEDIKKSVLEFGIPENKITIIPNGVDTEEFVFNKPREINENSIIKFLYVGRLVDRKNLLLLIETIIHLNRNDIRFDIIGLGPEEDHLRSYVKKNCRLNNISFLGYKKGKELIDHYQNCDVYVLPSFYEGLPFTLLESQSCGRPALIGNFSNSEKIVIENYNGHIVKENTLEGFKEGLLEFLTNKKKIIEMSYNARRNIEDKYSIENSFKETLKVFESVY